VLTSGWGRPNFVLFLFYGARKRIFKFFGVLFFGRKRHPHFRFIFFFGTKMAVKTKRKSVLWLSQCTAGRTPSYPQSHTAAVYIATRSAWILWSSKHWADSVCCFCCCGRLVSIALRARKFLSAPPSVASKQLFCAAGQNYSDRRSSLLEENAKKLLFLEYNIRLFDFKFACRTNVTERLT